MKLISKLKSFYFLVSIIYVIVGIIMITNPHFVCNAINYILGSLVILYGIVYLINLYQKKEFELFNKFNFLAGVMCISFGVFLLLNSSVLMSLIPFCSGILILIDAIYQIRHSISLKYLNSSKWWVNLIVGLLFLGFAVFLMINANNVTYVVVRIIGGVLIFDAIMDFYTFFCLKKYRDNGSKVSRKVLVEANVKAVDE